MKQTILVYIFLSLNCGLFAQNKDSWIAFWDKDTTHIGFKDQEGKIKIEPKFMGLTSANKFDGIMVVSEEINNSWRSYYLTKQGKKVGIDSLYIFDNGPDCENEGFIRFRDPKTDKMGFFNQDGEIIIPAEYSDLTRVRNGMIIALKDAEKVKHPGGDGHFSWIGGKEYLIDTNNKILIENFGYNDELHFYSLEKSKDPNKDSNRENFLGVDKQYYSFINFDREFKSWLQTSLLKNLSKENLLEASNDKITFWKEPNGWISEPKTAFINRNYKLIKKKLFELNTTTCDYAVFSESLNQFIYEGEEYQKYFNNCNQAKEWIFPVKNIVITPKNKNGKQDHFQFLRTENGYKLISMSPGNEELK
ncbi:MAG: WG repeat-containing protein [Flavobacterium sp.]